MTTTQDSPEPTAAAFGQATAGARARRLFLATRPAFMPASIAPVLLGSTWGYHVAGHFDWVVFALGLIATVCVHLACNVLNDVGDDIVGTDRINDERIFPYTGGSRFIQNGVMSANEMTALGVILLGVAALLGIALVDLRGPAVLVFGAIGVLLGILYSLPRLQLAAHGLGETAIAVSFGVLPVTGAAWLQSGRVDWPSVLMSVPISMWVAAILLMNEVPDRTADARAGKRTLAVRLGTKGTRGLYLALHITASAAFLGAALLQLVPWWTGVVALVLLPASWSASRGIRDPLDRQQLTGSIESTLRLHTVGSVMMLVSVLLATFL